MPLNKSFKQPLKQKPFKHHFKQPQALKSFKAFEKALNKKPLRSLKDLNQAF